MIVEDFRRNCNSKPGHGRSKTGNIRRIGSKQNIYFQNKKRKETKINREIIVNGTYNIKLGTTTYLNNKTQKQSNKWKLIKSQWNNEKIESVYEYTWKRFQQRENTLIQKVNRSELHEEEAEQGEKKEDELDIVI